MVALFLLVACGDALAQAELKALRAQIDPHFFFNAFNSVVALIPRDPAAAEELIEDLADLFRHSFKPSRDFIALGEELRLVETYLKVEKVRLGDKLQFNKVISPEALTIRIPALTVQPLVENAVKRGIGNLPEGGRITLSAEVEDGHLKIAVADTGAGLPSASLPQLPTRGVGLSNINERLSALYGAQSLLRIDSHPGRGSTVSFAIPLLVL
ncbi:MAG: sensor histidine kinase [Blastocatellia bacterium]